MNVRNGSAVVTYEISLHARGNRQSLLLLLRGIEGRKLHTHFVSKSIAASEACHLRVNKDMY